MMGPQPPTNAPNPKLAHNIRAKGQRMTMPLNQMAQASLRNQTSRKNTSGPPVGPLPNANPVQGLEPQGQSVQLPTGGPQGPMDPEFDPSIFAEQQLDQIIKDVRLEKFIQSPRVKDAMEAIRFKNIMNADNPRYQPDSRPLLKQVAARIGMDK